MRITEIENASIRTEAVAPRITIHWNPLDDSGVVHFQVQRLEFINGQFQRMLPEDDLFVPLADVLQRAVTVDGQSITGTHVEAFIKGVFDQLYAERAAAQAAAAE
ncbi:MAG: hypothetical protein ACOY5V_06995 [Pseudomonadota bacterium]